MQEQPTHDLPDQSRGGSGAESPSRQATFSGASLASGPWPGRVSAEAIGLGLLLVCSLALRLFSLEAIPPNVTADEADNLQVAYRILVGRDGPGLFGLDWMGSPAFSVYLIAAFMDVFGWGIVSMRLASVLLSTLALVPLYFVAREYLSVKASLVACFLASSSLLYLHFSRSGWQNVHVSLFLLMAAWCLTLALKGRGPAEGRMHFVLAGVFSALGMYSYFPGRLVVVSLLAFLPFALLDFRRNARRVLGGYALLLATAFVVFYPQVPAILSDWEAFTSRSSAVAITSAKLPYEGADAPLEVAVVQIQRNVRGFLLLDGEVVNNSRYYPIGRPILDSVTGTLYVLGLGVAFVRFRRYALWWCLFLIPLGATQLLSMWTPDLGRAVPLVPLMCLFAGLGFDALAMRGRTWTRVVQLAVLAALPWAAYNNVATYVAWSATPQMADARNPAVEVAEFATWQRLISEAARSGEPGFNVIEWRQMRGAYASEFTKPAPPPVPRQPAKDGIPAASAPPFSAPLAASLLSPDASFAADKLAQPRGVASGRDGSIYVVDAGAREIVRLNSDGRVLARWGGEGNEDGRFLEPWDIAVDDAGRVYVVDALQGAVQRFNPDGQFEARLLAREGLYRPRGIAVGTDGDFYVADTGRNRVLKLDTDGRVVAAFGRSAGGEVTFDQPTDAAVDSTGALWIVEPSAGRLLRLDAGGNLTGSWGYPKSDTIDAPHLAVANEWLLGTDPPGRRIVAFHLTADPVVHWQAPDEGATLARPFGIAADPAGAIAVSDSKTGEIRRFLIGKAD